jgi:hypothetical protein
MIGLLINDFIDITKEVFLALIPLLIVFLLFQLVNLKLPKKQLIEVIIGIVLTFLGLAFFIFGVNIGFISNGELIGKGLGELNNKVILVMVGFILGFVVTFAEPAIQILNHEVEKATGGYINKKIILYFLSLGVALSVALSLIRILVGWPLWYLLLPGYVIAFILTRYVSPTFVAIAFDSGGVVTGPMIATFLLALVVGASSAIEGSNPLLDGFGMISMVAVVPIITVLILGILYDKSNPKGGRR